MESLDSFVSLNDSLMPRPIPKELRDACHAVCVMMHRAETNGNVFLTRSELTRNCRAEHPYMKQALVEAAIAHLAQEKTLDIQQDLCAFRTTRAQESTLATFFARSILEGQEDDEIYAAQCRAVAQAEAELHIRLSESQRAAAVGSLSCRISVISGGAGSGKTTLLKTISHVMKESDVPVLMMAPTGKAARRMAKQACHSACTIHSALYSSFPPCFQPDGTYCADLIIVDESSMIDVSLMYDIIRHLGRGKQMILVGDPAQLPSIGPGHLLCDIIDSGLQTYRLTDNFRQLESPEALVQSTEAIRKMDADGIVYGAGFCLLPTSSPWDVEQVVLREYVALLREGANVQMLSPVRKTKLCSSDTLNAMAQQLLNPPAPGELTLQISGKVFHARDRVVQLKNNKHAKNGDVGTILSIRHCEAPDGSQQKIVTVDFDDVGKVSYREETIRKDSLLDHAWALTIHKAQGSEYGYVILPLVSQHRRSWYCNMIYTAVSRARKSVILVGDERVLRDAVQQPMPFRNTHLYEKIGILTHRRISA